MIRTALIIALVAACGGGASDDGGSNTDDDHVTPDSDDGDDDDQSPDGIDDVPPPVDAGDELDVFDPTVTDVTLEIDYETGAEPFTGFVLGFGDTFDTTQSNINRLFAGKKTLHIPRTTADMQNIGHIGDEELTVADLLTIADQYRDQLDSSTHKSYYLLFVTGYFTDASGPHHDVLGISLGHTGVIAMFKDVINSTNSVTNPNTSRYVEQSTLVHETAHAIGLVNNGVPLRSAHQDSPHGAHCTNDSCVMYYQNEGASEATSFALAHLLTGNSILFDAACLSDVDALTGGL